MQSYGFRMNYGSFVRICFMDKYLKIGLIAMVAAVILLPASILLKSFSESLMLAALVFTMILELIGLIFVMLSIIKRRKI